MSDELIGRTLGKYRIVSRIGRGGMARVYKAYQPGLDRYVALKVLHSHLSEENFINRFEQEAAAVARLRHPNIVQVHDFDNEGELYYMVMEFIEGPTLKTELDERKAQEREFNLDEVVHILSALAGAIDYAHGRNMVHRDLKPANIMFTAEGQVLLTDFGLARMIGSTHQSISGSMAGTPAYMAPEQCQGESGDARSDLYSLALILYEMVTGRQPYEGDTPFAILLQHLNEPLPLPSLHRPDLPAAVERVIVKAASKRPVDRYQSAGEMARALREAVGWSTLGHVPAVTINVVSPLLETGDSPISTSGTLGRTPTRPPSPYRGLFAFREEDAPFFFGRESFTDRLLETVQQRSVVAVVGPSGSGKSSVVFAGLIPRLREAGGWTIAEFRPGARPFYTLAAALLTLLETKLSETDRLVETRKLAEALQDGTLTLTSVIARIHQKQEPAGRLLLVADQFEEIYTLCPDAVVRRQFLDVILQKDENGKDEKESSFILHPSSFTLLLTLRADFLSQALSHRAFADALQAADVKLGPMTNQELGQAIESPAARQGAVFESGLVERILDDVGTEAGNLPLLEFALTLLWERQTGGKMTHAAYRAIGQVAGSLARYADQVYEELGEAADGSISAEQNQARRVLLQMVRPGQGTEDARRLTSRSELGEKDWQLVQRLADARLVITGRDPDGHETAELVHEALIQGWTRLQSWLDEDRQFLLWRQRLRAAMDQWAASSQDEGALLRGAPLAEAEVWLAEQEQAGADRFYLSPAEESYILNSGVLRRREAAEREAQRQRELETAQRLAEAERRRAEEQTLSAYRLRRQALSLRAALIAAAVLFILAVVGGFRANQNANIAAAHAATAQAASTRAVAEQIAAEAASTRAVDQQAIAEAESISRATAQAQAELAQQSAEREAERADEQAQVALANLSRLLATQSRDYLDQLDLALLLSVEAYQTAATTEAQDSLLTALESNPALITFLRGHNGRVNTLAASADGRWLASGGEDGVIMLWDMTTFIPLAELTTEQMSPVYSLAFAPDGAMLAAGHLDGTIIQWDLHGLTTGTAGPIPQQTLGGHQGAVRTLAYSPDGRLLASGGVDKQVMLWDAAAAARLGEPLTGHADFVHTVAFSPDGRLLASGSKDDSILLWDVASLLNSNISQPADPLPLIGHTDWVNSVAFSPNSRLLASAGSDGLILLWDTTTGQLAGEPLSGHSGWVRAIAFSPDGQTLVSGSSDETIRLWDVSSGQPVSPAYTGHHARIESVVFSPDGRLVVSAGEDGRIILWNPATGRRLGRILAGHVQAVNSLDFTPDGLTLISAGSDRALIRWDVASGALLSNWNSRIPGINAIAVSPDGRLIAAANASESITLWDVESGQPGPPLSAHLSFVQDIAIAPDGRLMASASADGTVALWDFAQTRRLGQRLAEHAGVVNAVAFSPNGRLLVSGGNDDRVILWDLTPVLDNPFTGRPLAQPLIGHTNWVLAVAFSPDGQLLASAGSDLGVMLWDVASGQSLGLPLSGHTSQIRALAFSPDGRLLVSAGEDNRIIVWDVASRRPVYRIENAHTGGVYALAFSPDGRTIASAGADEQVILWNVDIANWQQQACAIANRNLTQAEWEQFFGDEPYHQTCPAIP
jgi:WD40 repeat protein/serine/threonine protein kinase